MKREYVLECEPGNFRITGGDAEFTVKFNFEVVLENAQRMFDNGEFTVAVIFAHTACEIAVARIISQGFAQSNIPQVADAVFGLLNGYNIANKRVQRLFDALTGHDVKREMTENLRIWEVFDASVTRRNMAVHRGTKSSEAEARESLYAAKKMVEFLKESLTKLEAV